MNKELLYKVQEEIERLPQHPGYKLVLMQNHEDTISLRDGQTEQLQRATATSLAVNLFIDGRDGFFYTNNLQPEALSAFIRQAAQSTALLEPDPSRRLADPSRYYKGDGEPLLNFDATLCDMDPRAKIRLAQQTEAEVRGSDPRIISLRTRYADRQHQACYLISNGFQGYEESSRCTLTSIVTVDGEDGQHPMDGWGETRIFHRDLPHHGIATEALRRTLRKIGQRPIAGGTYRMILESPCAGNLLQPILSAMSGQALQQKMSFLQGQLGRQVLSPLVNIVDDPLIPGTRGACHFDFDGVATQRRTLFLGGVLQTYFIDTPSSIKLGMPPTTQGTHHLILEPAPAGMAGMASQSGPAGMAGPAGIAGQSGPAATTGPAGSPHQAPDTWHQLAGAGDCILVTDFNGGNCDPSTGNFSYGIEGFLVQGGEIAQPISGMNITGNILELWQHLTGIGDDYDPWETELIPSLVFDDVRFGGK